jgi:cation/acetate symporter
VDKWEKTGLLKFDDKNGDGLIQMAPGTTNELIIDRDIIVLATPEVAGLVGPVIALVAAGALAAALSTASGLLLVLSSALAHDIYYRLINPRASEALRVGVGRVMVIVGVLIAGYFGINPPGFVAEVVALAFGLAASSFFPIILLGVFDKRTNREGAIAGMSVGLLSTLVYVIAVKYGGMEKWWGISAEGVGTIGMMLNLATTVVVSRLTPPPPPAIQEMVESIRLPEGAGAGVILDEATE